MADPFNPATPVGADSPAGSVIVAELQAIKQVLLAFRKTGKEVVNNNAATAYTLAANTTYLGFTGTQAAALALTFPAAAAAINGLIITVMSETAIAADVTWISAGATFLGAPAALAANTPVSFIYHHATATWLRT